MAAYAAARQAALLRAEEEPNAHLQGFGSDWEFKIVRALTRRFRRREALAEVVAEEAAAGWQLVEKLDDARLRFARPIRLRNGDAARSLDPYRSAVGISQWAMLAIILGTTVGGFAVMMAALYFIIER